MHHEVKLPNMGEDMDGEISVTFWLVNEGDTVKKGEDLLELTTDKAAFTLPSPRRGTLVERLVEEGDVVGVGDVLCVLDS